MDNFSAVELESHYTKCTKFGSRTLSRTRTMCYTRTATEVEGIIISQQNNLDLVNCTVVIVERNVR